MDLNTVSVAGVGRVSGTPDTMALHLQVETRGADVSKALSGVGEAQRKVAASLKSGGVAPADIKSSDLGVRPEFHYENKPDGGAPKIIGYVAYQSLTVTLRDLDKAGAVITAAVTAGGNDVRVNGSTLNLEGNTDLVVQARAAAFADAKAKAEQYAKLSGRQLGAVTTVTELSNDAPPPQMYAASAAPAMDAASSVPIEKGSQEVAIRVQVVWALQ